MELINYYTSGWESSYKTLVNFVTKKIHRSESQPLFAYYIRQFCIHIEFMSFFTILSRPISKEHKAQMYDFTVY
jgi:hypothetical protein